MAEASDFIFGTQLGFAKSHHKITPRGISGHGLGLGSTPKFCGSASIFAQWLKLGTSNLVHSLGLPRSTIKPHPEEKWAWRWVRAAPIYWGFPLYFSNGRAVLLALAELFQNYLQMAGSQPCGLTAIT